MTAQGYYLPPVFITKSYMFPSLNEAIGWGSGVGSILPNSNILLGDSNPIDSLPFIYTFMNFWLKPSPVSDTIPTAIIFISFKTAQSRIINAFRKLYSLQLNLLSAQSKFAFVDASNYRNEPDQLFSELDLALKKTEKFRTLVILEGFALAIADGIGSLPSFTEMFLKIQSSLRPYNTNLLIHWSRDFESDYPGRNPVLTEDIRLGGKGWLLLLSKSHYIFCVRPLKSGMTRDASGEIVVALGPAMQAIQNKPNFHPTLTLFKVPTDNTIQCFFKGKNNL